MLLASLPVRCIVHADRAYDSNRIRDIVEEQGAVPNIPSKSNRRWKSCFSKALYKGRNAFERVFCRLKDCLRAASPRHTLRQARRQLPWQYPPRRRHHVVVMSLGPRTLSLDREGRRHNRIYNPVTLSVDHSTTNVRVT